MDEPESGNSRPDSVEDIIAHYGVIGMHWGVRKVDTSKPTTVVLKTRRPGKPIKTSGGKFHPASADATTAATSRQIAKKSSTDALTTKQLTELVSRMNMEQQYTRLAGNSRSTVPGVKFAKDILVNVGRQNATNYANDAVGKSIAKRAAASTAKAAKKAAMLSLAVG